MSGIAFAAPWVLAAAVAALAPVIAHLARHEARAGTEFPSLMFLRRVPLPSRARRRVQDRLLLALRVLGLLALVLAFAGPYPVYEGGAGPRPERDTVVLLDVSYSMGVDGRFQQAVAQAAEVIAATPSGERVALVAFDDTARVLSPLHESGVAANEALALAAPGHRGTDLAAALNTAARLLARGAGQSNGQDSGQRRARAGRVVLVSDLQAVGLGADPSLPADVELELRPVSGPEVGNLTLAAAWLQRESSRRDGRAMLRARVVNTGDRTISSSVRVHVDGLEAGERRVTLAAGASQEVSLPVFPAPERATRIALGLGDDGLAADNRRFLVAAPDRRVPLLLVGGDGTAPYLDAAFALAREPRFTVRRVAPAALDDAMLADARVVVLDAPLTGVAASALLTRAAEGLGVLAFATALASGETAEALLPGRVGPVLEAPAAGDSLLAAASSHPVTAALGAGQVAVGPVWRRLSLTAGEDDEVLARFDDGSPALLEPGTGAVLLLATSPAPQWSGIALRPQFAPFLLQAVSHLAGVTPAAHEHAPGSVLEPASLARSAALTGAHADALAGALARGDGLTLRAPSGALVRLGPGDSLTLDEPGLHELRIGASAPLPLAVSVETGESRLDALPVATLLARIARPPPAAPGAALEVPPPATAERARDESLARLLLVFGLALLLGEGLLAARMTRQRQPARVTA